MPVPGAYDPQPDLDRLGEASAFLPASSEQGYQAVSDDAALYPRVRRLVAPAIRFSQKALDVMSGRADPFQAFEPMDTDAANARYGVPGYLRFNAPVDEGDAADQAEAAQQRRWRDTILSRTHLNPLRAFGAGLEGSIVDPVGAPLMFMGGELVSGAKGLAAGAEGVEAAGEAGSVMARLGRVGNYAWGLPRVLGEGTLGNLPYVAADYGLRTNEGDDYTAGDALTALAAGAIFHTGIHYAGEGLASALKVRGRYADPSPDPYRPTPAPLADPAELVPQVPEPVADLTPVERAGAFAKAVDDMTADEPVDVGRFVERARQGDPEGLSRLDEPSAAPQIDLRPLEDSTAVTPRGTEVPVRYGLAELGDLTTSHDNDLNRNPDYPQELQPRNRERAGAIARNWQLEQELNPKLLTNDVSAAAGAPIVGPDGVVESGNGRTIALRRSAATGSPAYAAYVDHLKSLGLPVEGMKQPVLVRMRTEPMGGAERAALAREMNADVTERMGTTEQAMQDAEKIDAGTLAPLAAQGEADGVAGRRAFAKGFIQKVAPDQVNSFVDAEGRLSKAGEDRAKAALVAKAYGDPRLVEAVFETSEPTIKALGQALTEAAPDWALMRAAASRGEMPADLDLTDNLRSALDLVRHARESGVSLQELVEERLGQTEMFAGQAISAETEAFLRLFFRDEGFKRPLAASKVAEALKDYARKAQAYTPGPDLFGEVADVSTARRLLADLAERYRRAADLDGDLSDLADARGEAAGREGGAARPAVLDVQRPGENPDGGRSGLQPADGGAAEGRGGVPGGEGSPAEVGPAAEALADPELKQLEAMNAAYAAEHGLEAKPAEGAADPDTLAKAIDALAQCVLDAGEEAL